MKNQLVFCDIETTGLSWRDSNAIEIAYMTEDMLIPEVVIPYALTPGWPGFPSGFPWGNADLKAMEVNHFYERYPSGVEYSGEHAVAKMIEVMTGSTLVGANVRFDARFIEKLIGEEVWHHRLFDLQAYAAGVFGWDRPRSWSDICKHIEYLEPGFMTSPDHTAAADTLSVKQAYLWMWSHKA